MLRSIRASFQRDTPSGDDPAWVTVCECNAWEYYALQNVHPNGNRLTVRPGGTVADIMNVMPAATRAVVVQIDASVTTDFATVTPEFQDALAARGILVLNATGQDIRKRTIHQRCQALELPSARAEVDGAADEKLIIKTTLNAGGAPERKLVKQWGTQWQFAKDISTVVLGPKQYRIAQRKDISANLWTDPSLIMERYVVNPEGSFLNVVWLGNAAVVTHAWSKTNVKRLADRLHLRKNYYYWTQGGEHIAVGPASPFGQAAITTARRLGESLGLQFMAVDFVIDTDGTPIPVDVNKTTYSGNKKRSVVARHLQLGLNAMLDR